VSERPNRLVLWDVDGTLVSAGPAAREAFYRAVSSVLGRAASDTGLVQMSGKTDPQIALEILAAIAVEEPEARRHLPAVLRGLEENLAEAMETIRRTGRVMPGSERILRRLHETPGVLQTVLSGNLRANARIKLAAFGLDRWVDLDVGAYGSDAEDRAALVPMVLENVAARYGVRIRRGDVWVVGDTRRDLEAARAGGVRCLLVATGRPTYDELRDANSDALLPDLTHTDAVLGILLGRTHTASAGSG
jgi:phosphoglycolate phosphatase-like HAD superfamily hydrolase